MELRQHIKRQKVFADSTQTLFQGVQRHPAAAPTLPKLEVRTQKLRYLGKTMCSRRFPFHHEMTLRHGIYSAFIVLLRTWDSFTHLLYSCGLYGIIGFYGIAGVVWLYGFHALEGLYYPWIICMSIYIYIQVFW